MRRLARSSLAWVRASAATRLLLTLFMFGGMPLDVQTQVTNHEAMRKLRAMTWEDQSSNLAPQNDILRRNPSNPFFTQADFNDFARDCREGMWERTPG